MSSTVIAVTKSRSELVRGLNLGHASAIVVGTIIGSGIFLVPAEMMQAVGSARLVYLAWFVGGVLSFFGALTYAELGAVRPQAGGEYVYIRDAYGPLPGFLYGWTWFLIAKPASIATIALGIVRVLSSFQAFRLLSSPLISWHMAGGHALAITGGHLVAIVVTLLITGLNYVGVRRAGEFQLAFTVLKIALIVVIALLALTAASGSWSNFSTRYIGAKGGMVGFMAALVAALWAYDGWSDLNLVGGEISRPEKNIPVALIAGVGVVAILYMGMNAAVQFALAAANIAQSSVPASSAIAGLSWGAALVSVGMVVSMVVGLNGTTMSGGRVPFAVARDGYFLKSLAEVHPRFHTPGRALVVQAILAIVLMVVGGTFKELLSLAISAEWFFYMLAASTIFKFRWKEPGRPRPYRAWGYPVVPALFIAAAGVLLYYTFMDRPKMAVWCLLVNLAGIPVYLYFARRAASDSAQRSDA